MPDFCVQILMRNVPKRTTGMLICQLTMTMVSELHEKSEIKA